MNSKFERDALKAIVAAAKAAGKLMRDNLYLEKRINASLAHDIKLELDVRCQELIEKSLAARFPEVAVLGEEGDAGDTHADYRWVVDPIDGTVNFSYGIPHACVSIALQERWKPDEAEDSTKPIDGYETVVGVVFDPFCRELWTAIRGKPALLNGRPIRVSDRKALKDCLVSFGFAKSRSHLDSSMPQFNQVVGRVRKVRLMGSAALALCYVACGRFDAYLETGIRLWDIAAGGLIIECAGGKFARDLIKGRHAYRVVASNGKLKNKLSSLGS